MLSEGGALPADDWLRPTTRESSLKSIAEGHEVRNISALNMLTFTDVKGWSLLVAEMSLATAHTVVFCFLRFGAIAHSGSFPPVSLYMEEVRCAMFMACSAFSPL